MQKHRCRNLCRQFSSITCLYKCFFFMENYTMYVEYFDDEHLKNLDFLKASISLAYIEDTCIFFQSNIQNASIYHILDIQFYYYL